MDRRKYRRRHAQRPNPVRFEELERGEVLELPGCLTAGETPEEALAILTEAMAVWIESALENGDTIPEPSMGQVRVA